MCKNRKKETLYIINPLSVIAETVYCLKIFRGSIPTH